MYSNLPFCKDETTALPNLYSDALETYALSNHDVYKSSLGFPENGKIYADIGQSKTSLHDMAEQEKAPINHMPKYYSNHNFNQIDEETAVDYVLNNMANNMTNSPAVARKNALANGSPKSILRRSAQAEA